MDEQFEPSLLEQRIDRYTEGRLSEREAEALWSELLVEPGALDYLHTSAALYVMYRKPAAIRRIGLGPLLAVAALLFGTVLLLNLFRFTDEDYAAGLGSGRIDDTGYEVLQPYRDQAALTAGDSLFTAALNYAMSGELDRAREQFNRFVSEHGVPVNTAKAWLNIGIILFNQQKYAEAVEALQAAKSSDDGASRFFSEKLVWFEANALFRLNRLQESRSAAAEALKFDGTYHDEAAELIRFLEYKLGLTDYRPVEERTAPNQKKN